MHAINWRSVGVILAWQNFDAVLFVFHGHLSNLAPFPGCLHLQSLITCSMQVRRGKAWEICLCAVMLGRQRVDIQGAVPHKESWSPFCSVNLRSWRPEHSQGSINTICCSQCQGHLDVKHELHDCTEKICCKDCLPHWHSSVWNEIGIGRSPDHFSQWDYYQECICHIDCTHLHQDKV